MTPRNKTQPHTPAVNAEGWKTKRVVCSQTAIHFSVYSVYMFLLFNFLFSFVLLLLFSFGLSIYIYTSSRPLCFQLQKRKHKANLRARLLVLCWRRIFKYSYFLLFPLSLFCLLSKYYCAPLCLSIFCWSLFGGKDHDSPSDWPDMIDTTC